MASDPTTVTKLYEQLPLQAMRQVHDSYMSWYVDRVTSELDKTISGLRTELRENDAKEESFRPSPNEVVGIERLQRSGVTGVDLLDRMVEQGEDWLVLTMRRLDHFERTGLAPKDYSTWCEHALGGAYDWIDHERLGSAGGGTGSASPRPVAPPQQDWQGPRSLPDNPTSPVHNVPAGWNDGGYAAPMPAAHSGQLPQSAPDTDDGRGRRNVFKIFTN